MSLHIIIDGYNLIRQSARFSSPLITNLQQEREALIEALAAYKKIRHHKISVVFDGTRAPGFLEDRDRIRGIHVRFSHHGETADAVIKKMAAQEKVNAVVVSSDNEIVLFAQSQGAATMTSEVFEARLDLARHEDLEQPIAAQDASGWNFTTRKKGPSKRLPRRKRRNRMRTRKL
jgi:predicted RNA-binding protein with PIN domain